MIGMGTCAAQTTRLSFYKRSGPAAACPVSARRGVLGAHAAALGPPMAIASGMSLLRRGPLAHYGSHKVFTLCGMLCSQTCSWGFLVFSGTFECTFEVQEHPGGLEFKLLESDFMVSIV
eukprot:365247-Chlamydomonas_euryale.AAC.19